MAKKDGKLKHELHPIEDSFNELMKEFAEFKREQLKQYTADGQSIDVSAFENHFKTMFLFGRLRQLEKLVKGETEDVKEATGKGNKGTTTKAKPKSDDGQLQLGL